MRPCQRLLPCAQFVYDAQNRHAQATVSDSDEGSKVTFLHNALGQRVFKSEPLVDHLAPNATVLGQSYVYDEALGNAPMLLGEVGNGGAVLEGRPT